MTALSDLRGDGPSDAKRRRGERKAGWRGRQETPGLEREEAKAGGRVDGAKGKSTRTRMDGARPAPPDGPPHQPPPSP